jgi:hypothetical protein
MIRITRIEGESKQGLTKPLFCVGEDGLRYVVKGKSAGFLSITREWIAARLGTAFGLPIPRFELMELDPRLLSYDATGFAQRIGKGTVFGSRRLANSNEIQYAQSHLIPGWLRARVLLFDWWIANPDRQLSETGGNPNLLWDVEKKAMTIIDHNLAFDAAECGDFWTGHIFRNDRTFWTPEFRKTQADFMRAALGPLKTIWNELPEEWIEVNCGVDWPMLENLLWRFDREANVFWGSS